jgi:hypothetical protein
VKPYILFFLKFFLSLVEKNKKTDKTTTQTHSYSFLLSKEEDAQPEDGDRNGPVPLGGDGTGPTDHPRGSRARHGANFRFGWFSRVSRFE